MLENYMMDINGVVCQENYEPYTYDKKYVEDRYDTYGEKNLEISALRLGYVIGALRFVPKSILDVGYGNGAFLKECTKIIPECYGYDVTGYPLPEGVQFCKNQYQQEVDVVTFFDVLEHFGNPYNAALYNTKYMVISLPWFHNHSDEWFRGWKHRRPNEHLSFFNPDSMRNFAREIGFEMVSYTNIEDVVRPSSDEYPNILTCVLRKV